MLQPGPLFKFILLYNKITQLIYSKIYLIESNFSKNAFSRRKCANFLLKLNLLRGIALLFYVADFCCLKLPAKNASTALYPLLNISLQASKSNVNRIDVVIYSFLLL
jgi:hypothetical protein